jgi:hypothetical protein
MKFERLGSPWPQLGHPERLSRCTKLGDLENRAWFVAFNEETQRTELYLIRRAVIMSKLREVLLEEVNSVHCELCLFCI